MLEISSLTQIHPMMICIYTIILYFSHEMVKCSHSIQYSECSVMCLLNRAYWKNYSNLSGSHLLCKAAALKPEWTSQQHRKPEGQIRTWELIMRHKWREDQRERGEKVITPCLLVKTMTEFFLSTHGLPALCPLSGTAEEKDESELFGPPSPLPLILYFSVSLPPCLRSVLLCSAAHWGERHQLFIPQLDRSKQAEFATSSRLNWR